MAPSRLTIIGAGRMGSALIGGWIKAADALHVTVIDPNPSAQIIAWAQQGAIVLNPDPEPADLLVLAIKPQVFPKLVETIKHWIGDKTLVLSVMAGVSLATLQSRLGARAARAMPNTPGLIGKGVTILCPDPTLSTVTVEQLTGVLRPLGDVEGPLPEALLPAATVVSGCGPAYGYFLVEAMAAAGVAHGLDPDLAMRLARRTVEGAGALMAASPETAGTLRENVTSPNGVTEAALKVLMREDAMPSLFKEAFAKAIDRDRALSQETE
ncbi:MAG: pyrroline-5-carboxylate reductase [Pseudomonadota bacterium]